jgi:fructose-bisphosphate aldolase class 1
MLLKPNMVPRKLCRQQAGAPEVAEEPYDALPGRARAVPGIVFLSGSQTRNRQLND